MPLRTLNSDGLATRYVHIPEFTDIALWLAFLKEKKLCRHTCKEACEGCTCQKLCCFDGIVRFRGADIAKLGAEEYIYYKSSGSMLPRIFSKAPELMLWRILENAPECAILFVQKIVRSTGQNIFKENNKYYWTNAWRTVVVEPGVWYSCSPVLGYKRLYSCVYAPVTTMEDLLCKK